MRMVQRRSNRVGLAAALGIICAVLVVAGADAANPTTKVVPNTTTVLAAKHACAFKVIDKILPSSRRVERIYKNGRHVTTGPSRDKLTNAKSGASIVLNSSGTVSYRKGAAGKTHYTFTGPNVLYFYPGDRGPTGITGENGALYHLVGKVTEILGKDDVVTSFAFHGRSTELCRLIP